MVCALKTLNFGRGDCTPMCSRLVRQHISPQNEDSSCMIDFRSGFRMCKWKDGGDKLELPRRLGPSAIDVPVFPDPDSKRSESRRKVVKKNLSAYITAITLISSLAASI